jgi:hypothetical protein
MKRVDGVNRPGSALGEITLSLRSLDSDLEIRLQPGICSW